MKKKSIINFMKSVTLITVQAIINFSIIILPVVFFPSCKFSSESLSEYFAANAGQIVIRSVSFDRSYPADADGILSVPSSVACTATFYITNPEGTSFTASASLASDESSSVLTAAGLSAANEMAVSVADKEHVTVTYSRDMLVALERGGDISTTLALAPSDGSAVAPFTEKLRCNSVPPQVAGACVMMLKDKAKSAVQAGVTVGEYILCFNIEDLGEIHSDMQKLTILGLSSGTASFEGSSPSAFLKSNNLSSNEAWDENPQILYDDNPAEAAGSNYELVKIYAGNQFTAVEAGTPFYVRTGIPYNSQTNSSFTISLADTKGLSSSVTICAFSDQLSEPFCSAEEEAANKSSKTNSSTNMIYAIQLSENQSYYQLSISAPDSAEDAEIIYSVYSTSTSTTLALNDCVKSKALMNIPEGTYVVKAFARKNGWLDSRLKTWSITIGAYTSAGITIKTPESYQINFLVSPTIYKENVGGTAQLKVTIQNSSGETVLVADSTTENTDSELSDVSMILYDRGTAYIPEIAENSPYLLAIPSFIQADTEYYILVKVTFNSVIYSGQIPMSVVN